MAKRMTIMLEGYTPVQPIPAAARKGPLLITGGIEGIDPATGKIPASLPEQVRLTFFNLERVLNAAGGSWSDVVKMTFYVASADVRPLINEHWLLIFPEASDRPARHTRRIAHMPEGTQVQCVASAWIDD